MLFRSVLLAIAVCTTLLVLASAGVARLASHALVSAAVQGQQGTISQWTETAMHMHVGWLLIGFLIAFVPLGLSRGLMGRQRT